MSPQIGGIQGSPGSQENLRQVETSGKEPLGRALERAIADGSTVEGVVLEAGDGEYLVRVLGRNLRALATLPLFQGQHFRAVFDSSGEVPLLRLTEQETALLGSLPEQDRDVAAALLSRGLPIRQDALALIRTAWFRAGGDPDTLGSFVELWARGIPLSPEAARLVSQYAGMSAQDIASVWKKIREDLRRKLLDGESPKDAIEALREGDDDVGAFLRAHSHLSRPPREGIDPSLLAAAWWPAGDERAPMLARVTVSSGQAGERPFYRLLFNVEGDAIGPVEGDVESDGKALVLTLSADRMSGFEALRSRRHILRDSLEDLSMTVQHVGVRQGKRSVRRGERRLDVQA